MEGKYSKKYVIKEKSNTNKVNVKSIDLEAMFDSDGEGEE
jgi:hypothetical protein